MLCLYDLVPPPAKSVRVSLVDALGFTVEVTAPPPLAKCRKPRRVRRPRRPVKLGTTERVCQLEPIAATTPRQRYFLELFAGSARLSGAVA